MNANIMRELENIVKAGYPKCHAAQKMRAMERWSEYCGIIGMDVDLFGKVGDASTEQIIQIQVKEGELLSGFVAYLRVRINGKIRPDTIRIYIRQVQMHYRDENGRFPGKRFDGSNTEQLNRAILGVKRTTKPAPPRLPIMQQYLRLVKTGLDLENNGRHRALWALWLCQ